MPGHAAGIMLVTDNLDRSREGPADEMLVRAKAGDSEAFNVLMMRHEQRVVRLAWRLLGSREDALDAAQETFFRVFRHLGTFDERRDFAAWLYRIAVNVCRDLARKRRPETPLELVVESAVGEAQEDEAIEAQQRRLLQKALSTLTAKERAAIVLRDLEGIETAEVARLLNCTQSTIRSQICSARMKIRTFHENYIRLDNEAGKGQ